MRAWLSSRFGIFWHTSTNSDGKPLWRGGRFWLHWRQRHIGLEWSIPSRHVGLGVTVAGADADDDIVVHVGIGLLSLWVGISGVLSHAWKSRKNKDGHYTDDMETSVRFFDNAVWWQIWHSTNEWRNTTPRWRHGNWHPLDTIFGRVNHSKETLRTERVVIPMPEGPYPATIEFVRYTHKRPRAWWSDVIDGANIDPDKPIVIPGKGENSWDCDDDALYSLYTPAATVEEAIAAVVRSVMRDRRRYGGSVEWQPESMRVA